MSRKHKFHNKSGVYFVGFATVYWIDVFTDHLYLYISEDSRKEWLLCMFEKAAKDKTNMAKHKFWQHHNNPVQSGLVTDPMD